MSTNLDIKSLAREMTSAALAEDRAHQDISAALLPKHTVVHAEIVQKEPAVLCGQDFVNLAFAQMDSEITIEWLVGEGTHNPENTVIAHLKGPAHNLLSAERVALNFLQTLSAVATQTHYFVQKVKHTRCSILDTRKTIPLLRDAEKYAVRIGGGTNHRRDLSAMILLKENHLSALGGVKRAIEAARAASPSQFIEVEVETLSELEEALSAGVDRIMLDNFSADAIRSAVALVKGRVPLEVSGNVNEETIEHLAETGVDYISIGALTKHIRAIDFSMRFKTPL